MTDKCGWPPRYYHICAIGIAVIGGIAIFLLAIELFPYHSSNHDEGVYLQQAAMLLDGRLYLTPGSEMVREAVHPWFFVEADPGLYPKYNPVPAAIFAIGLFLGEPRVMLALIAITIAILTYGITKDTFDRRTGVLATGFLISSPLFLMSSSVFLPYAPTAALNLLFVFAYIRSVRRRDGQYAMLAGIAIGLAFFARPYTALLVALPFIAHSLYHLAHHPRRTVSVQGVTGVIGVVFLGITLGYNALLTGDPLVFPYEAFAPHDGLGFGYRRILGHEIIYTPGLALEATGAILTALALRWYTAPPIGAILAVVGIAMTVVRFRQDSVNSSSRLPDQTARVLFVGVIGSVIVGNLYFWGNLNILGAISDPTDGFIATFGPFYHYDLLFPLSAFTAHAIVTGYDKARDTQSSHRLSIDRWSEVLGIGVGFLVVVALTAGAMGPPVDEHAAYTAKYESAYAPVEQTDFENALVFLPPVYGEWMNHPFQWLRNNPTFDGPVVYAISRHPPDDFAVIDAFPERDLYRYRYHGTWTPDPTDHVIPRLESTRRVTSRQLTAETTVRIPDRITHVDIGLSNGEIIHRYAHTEHLPARLVVHWKITRDSATIAGPSVSPRTSEDSRPVPIETTGELSLIITITEPGGGTLTYREDLLIRPSNRSIEVVWPPSSSVCLLVTDCGTEGTYIPDHLETRPTGIRMNTTIHSHSNTTATA